MLDDSDFIFSEQADGFRLLRMEVLNWGTFHQQIWTVPASGNNSLVTGDIGSGKSTLVDGLTTLLVPPRKILYNRAAGAGIRERSLRSYIQGYYKSAKDSDTLSAKSIALRDSHNYSVLLASFSNAKPAETITLAQVFWCRDNQKPPERFYVVAGQDLTVAEHFTRFEADLPRLKKRLGKTRGITVYDSFSRYATAFRRKLGIDNPQALDLFYQTVSMKAVGNLTEFVRLHMLEEPPVQDRIQEVCRQFEDLNKAHEAVLRARHQVEKLAPIVGENERYTRIEDRIGHLKGMRAALHAHFSNQKIRLLRQRLYRRKKEHEKRTARIRTRSLERDRLLREQSRLERAISESGGRRLEELAERIERLTRDRRRISARADTYRNLCTELELPFPAGETAFTDNRQRLDLLDRKLRRQREDIDNRLVEARVQLQRMSEEVEGVEAEIRSLKKRKSNLPRRSLLIRKGICDALRVPETGLPFAGELLRVKEAEAAWEGAIERLLRGFGLSLLVPEDLYARVAGHVDSTHLAGRLVYFRASAGEAGSAPDMPRDSILRKVEIKGKTPFYDWLERELARRYNYTCCADMAHFRRMDRAISAAGQIKSSGMRHEKDDRFRIGDRSRYILGWQNREKIRFLQERVDGLQTDCNRIVSRVQELDRERKSVEEKIALLQRLLTFDLYAEIHWEPLATEIEHLSKEKREIEKGSDLLRTLQGQLEKVKSAIGENDDQLARLQVRRGKVEQGLESDLILLKAAEKSVQEYENEKAGEFFADLAEHQPESLGGLRLTIENCDNAQTRMREWLQQWLDNEEGKSRRSAARMVRLMQEYKGLYPAETREVDAAVEAAAEFGAMLATLQGEDLPRHEQRFKTMLNEGTIQSIALFQAKLESELADIREKIDTINRSLSAIDYDEGTAITLVHDASTDVEIRQFRQELRACLGDTLTGSEEEAYTENKFLQVKAIIERFSGRTGYTDQDRRWTRKVTDVRNWLLFSVSERWREDDREKEFYSDTAGKSGGQKEKLAYTILAAALVYQFGLKHGRRRSRSFRFVMIDEAFGRGSDDSTRYALELFRRLGLQLLIVTPLQKIHVIEDYVRSVHYIHNRDGRCSMVRNLTIEQYREEKAQYTGGGQVA